LRKLFVITILFFPPVVFAQYSIEGVWVRGVSSGIIGGGFENWDLSWGRRMLPRGIHLIVDLHADRPIFVVPEWTQAEIISLDKRDDKTELKIFFPREEVYAAAVFHFNDDGTIWIEEIPLNAHTVVLYHLGLAGSDRVFHKIDGPEFDVTFDYIRRARSSVRVHTTVEDLPLHRKSNADSPVITIIPAGSLVQFQWWEPEMEVGYAWVLVTAVHSAGLPKVVEVIAGGIARRVLASGWAFTDMFVGMTERFLQENLSE